jgi:hypothetical protein
MEIEYIDPWRSVSGEESSELKRRLDGLVSSGHSFHGLNYRIVAAKLNSEEVLCEVVGYQWQYAIVDITDTGISDLNHPSFHRLNSSTDFIRHMMAHSQNYIKETNQEDVNLEMPEGVAKLLFSMQASCELLCCGYSCIEWDEEVYKSNKTIELDEEIRNWINYAREKINETELPRYIKCDKYDIDGSDPEITMQLFSQMESSINEIQA